MVDFKEECTGCGACVDVCPFLAEYGTPQKILSERPDAAFYCTNCRRCDAVCPLDLSPSAAFFTTKQQLLRQHQIPLPVQKALAGARGFAKTGHGFPFSFYGTADTVFWPGCGLAAHRSGLVREVRKTLSSRLHKQVGLVLDCCGDPAYGFGDTETVFAALKEINERLRDHDVRQVITGCLNCYKLLQHLEDIQVVFILELLPPDLSEKPWKGPAYLHHPCPSSRWEGIQSAARNMFNHLHTSTGTVSESASLPAGLPTAEAEDALEAHCCGAGGGLCSSAPELAERFFDRTIVEKGNQTMVTYCVGCQDRFLNRGVEAVHLLECLPGVTPRRKVTSPLRQWTNRLTLATIERLRTVNLFVLMIIALMVGGGIYLNRADIFSPDVLMNLLGRFPVFAPLIFLGIYAIAPALFLPSIPLTLAAGFFWGPVWGVVFSISGATIGACLSFFLARYLFQDKIKEKVPQKRWEWLQGKVIQHGWKAVAFTRLIPIFPFNLLNYLFGLTPIRFRDYLLSTIIFMLPACIAFVAFGSSLGELIVRGNVRGVVLGIAVAVCAFMIPVALRPFFGKIGKDGANAGKDKK